MTSQFQSKKGKKSANTNEKKKVEKRKERKHSSVEISTKKYTNETSLDVECTRVSKSIRIGGISFC